MTQEPPSSAPALRVLHLVGGRSDTGGVLSVLRSLQSARSRPALAHVVWVDRGFRETREPSLDYRYARYGIPETDSHWRLALRAIPAVLCLLFLLRRESFDVLHAHSRGTLIVAWLASLWARRDVVFTNHNYAKRRGLYRWFARRKRIYSVVLTPNMARYYGIDPRSRRVSVISACFDDAFLDLELVEPRAGPPKLVGVGSLTGWKRWDLLVEAIADLGPTSSLELHVYGPVLPFAESERFAADLERRVDELGLAERVFLHGAVDDVPRRLREAHWFVLPSRNEPCSVALMEALALGLPALVADSGGSPDLVGPRSGVAFKTDDRAHLRQVLEEIVSGRVSRGTPASIRESVVERSASRVAEAYEALYRKIVADRVAGS